MTTESQVLQELRSLNPIIDEQTVPLPETSSTAFLATLRRQPMTAPSDRRSERATGSPRGRRSLALAAALVAIVAAVGVTAWLADDESSGVAATPLGVAEEFIELRSRGDLTAALELMTDELAEQERDFFEGLEVWNIRGKLVAACRELSVVQVGCTLSEEDDFHAAGGVTPFSTNLRLTVNDAGLISSAAIGVTQWGTTLQPFNNRFIGWLQEAHPEEAAKMTGVPMSEAFNADDARIALQFVDEFVAQSDRYPIVKD